MHKPLTIRCLIITPHGIPLVTDLLKPLPHYWKLVGGKRRKGEGEFECLKLNVLEKTGIRLSENNVREVWRCGQGVHAHKYFLARLRDAPPELVSRSSTNIAQYFPESAVLSMSDLFASHRQVIERILKRS